MDTALTASFNQVIEDVSAETKTLACLSNLVGITNNPTEEILNKIDEIESIVELLEQKFADVENYLDSELSCLDLLSDLAEKVEKQSETIAELQKVQ